MLLSWSFLHTHLQVCLPTHPPPHPSVSERLKRNFNKVKKCIALERVSGGPTHETFWPFKTNLLQFYNRFAHYNSITTRKIDFVHKVLIITVARWFGNWCAICYLKLLILFGTSIKVLHHMVTWCIHLWYWRKRNYR